RLRVPKHTPSLPLWWKAEVLNTPILRCFKCTPYSYELYKSLSMTYELSRQALKELGRDAKFKDDIRYYNFRRWTGILRARSGKGCLVNLATPSLKNIINHNLLDAISSMSFFFDHLRRALYVLPEVCLGKGMFTLYISFRICISI
ncbi:hypothetical protein N7495_007410, partial [Penicillium taxi]|uniref:uncharacterized protein n=1 Tax=Penicillium taxi TaxID=168475 RepID=UPI0025451F8C